MSDNVVRLGRPTCPICGKTRVRAYRPFCSRRCADIDLGRWFGGIYAVPSDAPPDDADDAPPDDDGVTL